MQKAKKVTNESGVTFTFADGEILECNVGDLPRDIVERLAIHGISQKVGDSYAAKELSIRESFQTASTVWGNLVSGLWAVKASRGGKLVEAIHRVTGQPLELCLEKVQAMDDTMKKALMKRADVKKALADMAAEAAERAAIASGEHHDDLNELF